MEDLRAGQICATIANFLQATMGGKVAHAFRPQDFFPSLADPREETQHEQRPTVEQMQATFWMIAAAHNAAAATQGT